MPRQYPALPYKGKPDVFLKAPDWNTHLDQKHYGATYQAGRVVENKADTAERLIRTLLNIERQIQGSEFTLYRFAKGLAVKYPEPALTAEEKKAGKKPRMWTVMMYYPEEGQDGAMEVSSEESGEGDETEEVVEAPTPTESKRSRRKA